MYNEDAREKHIRYCDFVPGYGFYSIVGHSYGGGLYNLIERIIGFIASIRR